MIEFALATFLKSKPTITAIVGNRVYEGRAPQNTSKQKVEARIVYRLLQGSTRHYHSTGASGLVEADIELMLVAESYLKARELYEEIRNEVDGFSGEWDGTEIERAVLSTPSRASGDPTQGDDTGFPAVHATVSVFYHESIPTLGNE